MPRPMKPPGTKLHHTAVRLPLPIKAKLDSLAQHTGLSLQEHMRRAIEAHLEAQEQKGNVPARARRRPTFIGRKAA